MKQVFCIGTADTKLDELQFLADGVKSAIDSFINGSTSASKVKAQNFLGLASYLSSNADLCLIRGSTIRVL